MRHLVLSALAVVCIISCKKNKENSQEPIANNKALSWIKTYGGTNYDFANAVVQLPSGEYVVAGSSRSADGDVPGTRVGYDTWITKLDTSGNKLWSTTFGTNTDDYATAIAPAADGGFLVVGYSGFLLENNGIAVDSFPNYAWIIRINASGQKQWEKNFSNDSKALNITPTSDGAFVVVGYTSTASPGVHDGWAIKIDANGNQVWNRSFGGPNEDKFASVTQTSDGGFIIAGSSRSDNIVSYRGSTDGWITKLSAGGEQVWSKTFGGSNTDLFTSIIQTSDGGYLAVGHSNSDDGDITVKRGGYDELIVKIDASGAKQWSKSYGGRNNEIITTVVNTADGGYLTAGYTVSTDFDVNRTAGDWGAWLIKTDKSGTKTASSTYGDQYDNITDKMINTKDGGYLLVGHTDVPGKGYDAWVVKIGAL